MSNDVVLFVRATDDTKRGFDSARGNASRFGSSMKNITTGIVASVSAGFAVDKIIGFGSEMLSLGGTLEAWRRKVDTVFEGNAESVRQWADGLNERFGVTDDELAGLAASFGDLLKPMGFTADQAATMSQDVIGLAGALSEWSGGQKSAAEVSEILSAAMLGERDALQSLGISIAQSEIDARLAAKGQEDLTGQLRQQAEALATQELLFEKSTDAQNAYAAGAPAAIEATNNFKAAFAELKEDLAEEFAPKITEFITWLTDEAWPAIQTWVADIRAEWAPVWAEISVEVGRLMDSINELFDTLGIKTGEGKANTSDFSEGSLGSIGELIEGLLRLVRWWVEVGNVVASIGSGVAGVLEWIGNRVRDIGDAIAWVIGKLGQMRDALSNMPSVGGSIGGLISGAQGLFNKFSPFAHGGIAGGWSLVGEAGPELVNLPHGSTVHTAGASARMLAQGGGAQPVVLEFRSSGSAVDDLFVEMMRRFIQTRHGGNVQAALGVGPR